MPSCEYPPFDPDATLDEFTGVGENRRFDQKERDEVSDLVGMAEESFLFCLLAARPNVFGDSVVKEFTTLPVTRPNLTEHLREAWKHIVEEEEWVLRKVGPVTLQKAGVS